MTALSHSQLGNERITLCTDPEKTEKKDGESEERKRPGLKQRINPETKICILDFDLGIKLENETPKPILSDKDKHILVYQEQCPWHRPFNARYKEYTRNSLHQEAKQYMSRTFPCLRWIDKHTTEGKTLKLHFEADQALFPQ